MRTASHDSRETFARVSHDVRANFNQFYFVAIKSRNGLIYVAAFLSLVQVAETKLGCVCEGLVTDWRNMRRLGDCFAMIFVAQKSIIITCLKLWRTVRDRSRPVCDACEDLAIPCDRFATV